MPSKLFTLLAVAGALSTSANAAPLDADVDVKTKSLSTTQGSRRLLQDDLEEDSDVEEPDMSVDSEDEEETEDPADDESEGESEGESDSDSDDERSLEELEVRADKVEIRSSLRSQRDDSQLRMKLRTDEGDAGIEFSVSYKLSDDAGKSKSKTKFSVLELWAYEDANANGLLDPDEEDAAKRMSLKDHWAPLSCEKVTLTDQVDSTITTNAFKCTVCNTADEERLPDAGLLCFEMTATEDPVTAADRTIDPRSIKLDMDWNEAEGSAWDWGDYDSLALVVKFKSEGSFRPIEDVATDDTPEEQNGIESETGSGIRWERRVFDANMTTAVGNVNYGSAPSRFFADNGDDSEDSDSEEEDEDGDVIQTKAQQISFSVGQASSFKWDPVVYSFTGAAGSVVPCWIVVSAAALLGVAANQ